LLKPVLIKENVVRAAYILGTLYNNNTMGGVYKQELEERQNFLIQIAPLHLRDLDD
jgi:hypothetical protein